MPPKAPPAVGVKKKIVKTIRKVVPKSKTLPADAAAVASITPPSAASIAPLSAASIAPPSAAEEPIPAAAASTAAAYIAPPSAAEETIPAAAASSIAPPSSAEEPIPADTTSPSAAIELDTTPTPSDPPVTETPPSDTAAAVEPDSTPAASEPPAADSVAAPQPTSAHSESGPLPETTPVSFESAITALETTPEFDSSELAPAKPAAKTITRVRKVVKKKIIVKRVPKTPAADKEKEVGQPAAEVQNPNPNPSSDDAKVQNPNPNPNPRSDDAEVQNLNPIPDTAEVQNAEVQIPNPIPDTAEVQNRNLIPDVAACEALAKQEEFGGESAGTPERRSRKRTEIFIGGLDRNATEGDIRKVFGRVGEIVEVRLMMEGQTGKNKGYAFLRYAEPAQAKKAVAELAKVEVCGKPCGPSALEVNDTIFLGSIDKKWKKEDIMKLLVESGVEKIDTLTVMADPHNAELNRGFAFLELKTNRDAQAAFKKLQKQDVFGKGRNVKVAWAEPMNDPDEEEMQKVKSVYVEGLPSSWDENKVRDSFKRFGEIQRIVLSRNIQSAKRKDFAFVNYTTREAALSCIEAFDKEGLTDNGEKVNVKVSLAKPVQKSKQNKGGPKSGNKDVVKEKPKAVERNAKVNVSLVKGSTSKGGHTTSGEDMTYSTTLELLHVLREQATWKEEQTDYSKGRSMQSYTHALHGSKRPVPASGDDMPYSDLRGYPRARLDTSFPLTSSSYRAPLHGMTGSSLPDYQNLGVGQSAAGRMYDTLGFSNNLQGRQGGLPYGSRFYSRF